MSQNVDMANIRGFVYEEETGEPAIFCNVYLEGTMHGASTDVNGYFLISHVPPGDYTLTITYLGYDTIRKKITLKKGIILSSNYYLKKSSVKLETIVVSAEREAARTQTKTSVVTITPKAINRIPSIGGQPDIAQYLQIVPGIIFTGDQGGRFYVRGGAPIQNKIILDGMTIYNPLHSIGLYSVFETDLIRNASIYTGGYNADYGSRISSVMDITYKDGNKKRISGSIGASTFGARAVLQGPLKKQKTPDDGSITFVFSTKGSYLAESSKVLYSYANDEGLPFNYLDFYGKLTLSSANGSKISFFGFNFNDNVKNYEDIADFGWSSWGAGSHFVVIPGKSTVLIEGLFAYSEYHTNIESTALTPRESYIGGFDGNVDFTYFFGKSSLKYGIGLQGLTTDYQYIGLNDVSITQKENSTQLGLYVKYKVIAGKFIIEPGLRIQWYASISEVSPEPRLSVKYNITDNFRLKFAGGLYSQNLVSATSDRDVVNLFYGFLTSPQDLPDSFDGKEINSKLQKSDHVILGAEINIGRHININAEGYYKYFPQITNINRQKIYTTGNAPPNTPDVLKTDFIIEKGNAYGLDVTLKYDYRNFYVWLVYSLGYVNRKYENEFNQIKTYTPLYDRRHNVNFLASYTLGSRKQYEFNLRWNFGTGFPFNQVQGFYEYLTFSGGVDTDYTHDNGKLGLIYGDLYGGRLPTYSRLDFDFKRTFFFSENTRLSVNVSVTNVYNRKNVFYVDLVTNEVVYQLPIMPSLGVNFYF
jgi:hypothetical protein